MPISATSRKAPAPRPEHRLRPRPRRRRGHPQPRHRRHSLADHRRNRPPGQRNRPHRPRSLERHHHHRTIYPRKHYPRARSRRPRRHHHRTGRLHCLLRCLPLRLALRQRNQRNDLLRNHPEQRRLSLSRKLSPTAPLPARKQFKRKVYCEEHTFAAQPVNSPGKTDLGPHQNENQARHHHYQRVQDHS